jgi:hypothetical protein
MGDMRPFLVLSVLAACASQPASTDIVGPFTGPVHRYAIDRFDLPTTNNTARQEGDDLDGDGTIDNQLGMVMGALRGTGDLTTHVADMLASGALQSAIEIVADDLDNDPSVGVRYVGAPNVDFTIMGGAIVDGAFTSNRTKTTVVPGAAELILPVFMDADPVRVHAIALELSYTRAADGGLDVRLAGGIDPTTIVPAIYTAIVQMVAADPPSYRMLMQLFDANHDYVLTPDEIARNSLLESLLAPDLDMFDAKGNYRPGAPYHNGDADTLSFGFTLHAVACDAGTCAGAIVDPCHDRVKDGDETDVDCGGSCGKCPGGETCAVAADCQSQACNGTCAAPTCSDGVRDGFESDVDCGGNCARCGTGMVCTTGADCATGYCAPNGTCATN